MFLTDEQRTWIEPQLQIERKKTGRPRASEREAFEAILFMLHTGVQWRSLPAGFPPKPTVHDYRKLWCERDCFHHLFAALIDSMPETGKLDLSKGFVDATFAAAMGGGAGVGLTRKGKGTKMQVITDGKGVSLGLSVDSASVGEPGMVQQTLAFIEDRAHPDRLVGDKA